MHTAVYSLIHLKQKCISFIALSFVQYTRDALVS